VTASSRRRVDHQEAHIPTPFTCHGGDHTHIGPTTDRGRLVGGCSAINACFALRGHPGDYDGWAALGNPGWSFADVLPAFAAVERDLDHPDEAGHGTAGPLAIRRYPADELTPLQRMFLDAAEKAGHPAVPDHNSPGAVGAGRLPTTCVDGRRISTAVAFLDPVRHRPNLHIAAGVLVTSSPGR